MDLGNAGTVNPAERDREKGKRDSSSSEEGILNSSKESCNVHVELDASKDNPTDLQNVDQILYQRFLDCRLQEQRMQVAAASPAKVRDTAKDSPKERFTADDHARQMILQAENAKTKMMEVPGKNITHV